MAASWPVWLTVTGPVVRTTWAKLASGTSFPEEVETWMFCSISSVHGSAVLYSRMTL